jgi:hypothetical protein
MIGKQNIIVTDLACSSLLFLLLSCASPFSHQVSAVSENDLGYDQIFYHKGLEYENV